MYTYPFDHNLKDDVIIKCGGKETPHLIITPIESIKSFESIRKTVSALGVTQTKSSRTFGTFQYKNDLDKLVFKHTSFSNFCFIFTRRDVHFYELKNEAEANIVIDLLKQYKQEIEQMKIERDLKKIKTKL